MGVHELFFGFFIFFMMDSRAMSSSFSHPPEVDNGVDPTPWMLLLLWRKCDEN